MPQSGSFGIKSGLVANGIKSQAEFELAGNLTGSPVTQASYISWSFARSAAPVSALMVFASFHSSRGAEGIESDRGGCVGGSVFPLSLITSVV